MERLQRYHEARHGKRMTDEELREHVERETGGVVHEPDDHRPPWMRIAQVGDVAPAWDAYRSTGRKDG